MESELAGIKNAHLVTKDLYRGGDFSDYSRGIATLKDLGITSVLCFKNAKDDSFFEIAKEEKLVTEAGMHWFNYPLDNNGRLSYDDIDKVPAIVKEIDAEIADGAKVFGHCHEGKDRTGVVMAIWEITHGSSVDDAIRHMKKYGAHFYNWGMKQAVRHYKV